MLPYKIAIIPCASKKIETSTPVQAIHLYSKSMYFKQLADLASRLAEEIWILSAINVKVRNLINFFKIKNFDYRDLPAGQLRNPIGKPINHQQLKSGLRI